MLNEPNLSAHKAKILLAIVHFIYQLLEGKDVTSPGKDEYTGRTAMN